MLREKAQQSPEAQPLSVRRAFAAYGGRPGEVLHDVSLEIRAGELVGVLGPNGAGKTTLVRVLAGTLAPDAGDVRLFGAPLGSIDRRDVARTLAVVAQDETPAFGWTVRQIVAMGRAPHQGGWLREAKEDEAIVAAALRRCDIEALADRPVSTLSGGERKRVTIARALAQSPRVLLLDEPAAFLDVRHQIALYELLVEEVARARLACVVVMHDLNVAAQYADVIILMKAGRVVAVGPPADVLTAARVGEVFDVDLASIAVEGSTICFLPRRARGPQRSKAPRAPSDTQA